MKKILSVILAAFLAVPLFAQINSAKLDLDIASMKKENPFAQVSSKDAKEYVYEKQKNFVDIATTIMMEDKYVGSLVKNSALGAYINTKYPSAKAQRAAMESAIYQDFKKEYKTIEKDEAITAFIKNPDNKKYISKITDGFDYAALIPADTQVLIIGEYYQHNIEQQIPSIIDSLKKSSKFELGYFAAEVLPDGMEDAVCNLKNADDMDFLSHRLGKGDRKDYLALFKEVMKDFKLIGLEQSEHLYCGIDVKNNVDTKSPLYKQIYKNDPAWALYGRTVGAIAMRNEYWATLLSNIIEDGKLNIVYNGVGHNYYKSIYGSLADRLNERGVKTVVISYFVEYDLGGKFKNKILLAIPAEQRDAVGSDYVITIR